MYKKWVEFVEMKDYGLSFMLLKELVHFIFFHFANAVVTVVSRQLCALSSTLTTFIFC